MKRVWLIHSRPTMLDDKTTTATNWIVKILLARGRRAKDVAEALRWSQRKAASLLKEGEADPLELLEAYAPLLKLTEAPAGALLDKLVANVFPDGRAKVARAVAMRVARDGITVASLPVLLGMPAAGVRTFFRNGVIPERHKSSVARWLSLSTAEAVSLDAPQALHRLAPTQEDLGRHVQPLWAYLHKAARDQGVSPSVWLRKHNFGKRTFLTLFAGGAIAVSEANLARLATATGMDEPTIRRAYRVAQEHPIQIIVGSAWQLSRRLQGVLQQPEQTIDRIHRESGAPPITIARILDHNDACRASPVSLERLRLYLKIEPLEWVALIGTPPKATPTLGAARSMTKVQSLVTDDDEFEILRMWRKASEATRHAALTILRSYHGAAHGEGVAPTTSEILRQAAKDYPRRPSRASATQETT